jgi:hypothetical protein
MSAAGGGGAQKQSVRGGAVPQLEGVCEVRTIPLPHFSCKTMFCLCDKVISDVSKNQFGSGS